MLPIVTPTLAEQTDVIPSKTDYWVFELKYDGIRVLAYKEENRVRLINRSGNDITSQFPAIVSMVNSIPGNGHVFDGEIVVFDKDGISHLDLVATKANASAAHYVMFDMPFCSNEDMRNKPLKVRRKNLEEFVGKNRLRLKLAERMMGVGGATAFNNAMKRGLEGIVAKDNDGLYPGTRYNRWIKIKCYEIEEFDVVGFVPSDKRPFSSLLLYDGKRYVGHVGSGFPDAIIHDLAIEMARLINTNGKKIPKVPRMPKGTVTIPMGIRIRVRFLRNKVSLRFPSFVSVVEGASGSLKG